MKRVVAYLKVQVRTYFGAKSSIFISLLFPIMITFIFGSIMPPEYLKSIVPGLIGFSILTYSLFSVTSMSSKYRLMNIFSELSLTPLRRSEWLLSVVVWNLLIGALSFFVIIMIAHFAFSVSITFNVLIIPFVGLATLLFVALGILIGSVAKTMETASLLGNAVGFPMMMLTGTFFPIEMLPGYLQSGIRVLPLYYFNNGLSDIINFGDIKGALLNMLILAILSAVFFTAAVYLFKWRRE